MTCSPLPTLKTVDFYLVRHCSIIASLRHPADDRSDIGVLSALLQARHVRPSLARLGEIRVASYGCFAAVFGFICLTLLPLSGVRDSPLLSTGMLYAAATGLAYTSATVVTALTSAAAACCDEDGSRAELQRGRALGVVRSKVTECAHHLVLRHTNLAIGPAGQSCWTNPCVFDLLAAGANDLLCRVGRVYGAAIVTGVVLGGRGDCA